MQRVKTNDLPHFEPGFRIDANDILRPFVAIAGAGINYHGKAHSLQCRTEKWEAPLMDVLKTLFERHFHRHGLTVPEIYGEALSQGAYLEEDLGDTTLFEFLSKNRRGAEISEPAVEAYRKVVAILPRFQVEASRDLDYSVCYPSATFGRQSIAWDLNYFKYYFLRLAAISFNEQALENDFNRLADFLLTARQDYFLYRDF